MEPISLADASSLLRCLRNTYAGRILDTPDTSRGYSLPEETSTHSRGELPIEMSWVRIPIIRAWCWRKSDECHPRRVAFVNGPNVSIHNPPGVHSLTSTARRADYGGLVLPRAVAPTALNAIIRVTSASPVNWLRVCHTCGATNQRPGHLSKPRNSRQVARRSLRLTIA